MSNPDRDKRVRARNDAIVDGPVPFTLTGPDGRSRNFLLTRHGPAELLAMRRWIRGVLEPKAKGPALPFSREELDSLKPKEREILLKAYGAERARTPKTTDVPIDETEAMELVLSPEGVARMIWLSAKRHQPGITLEDIMASVTEANVTEANEAYAAAMIPEGDDDPKTPRPNLSSETSEGPSVGPRSTASSPSSGT